MVAARWPRWPPYPYMVKTFKNLLLQNRGWLGTESLHKPSGTGGINLRWPSSCLYLLYFPATVLFTCIKLWFFRNHLANFHQILHWSYCWNVIDSLFKWLCSIDCQAHIFFFKTKNCSNDDLFIGCDDRIGKMLHNICISAVVMSLRWASRGPWASCSPLLPSLDVNGLCIKTENLNLYLMLYSPPTSAVKWQGNGETDLQCQAARHCHHQIQ